MNELVERSSLSRCGSELFQPLLIQFKVVGHAQPRPSIHQSKQRLECQACASPFVVICAPFKLYYNVSCEQGLSARGRRRGGLWESVEQQQTSSVSGTSWAESPPPALISWLLCSILPPSGILRHILKLLRVLTKASCEVNKDLEQVHWKCDFVFAAEVFQSRSKVGS